MAERGTPDPRLAPVPERFRAAFGVGAEGEPVHPADAVGVPLAAIQGLFESVSRNREAIDDLAARLDDAERAGARPPE